MKRTKLNIYGYSNGKHTVALGNGYHFSFNSKAALNIFLSETAKFLQSTIIELNEIFIDLYSQHRRNIFYTSKQPAPTPTLN